MFQLKRPQKTLLRVITSYSIHYTKLYENNYSIITTQKNFEISEENNSWANTGALPTVSFVGSAAQTYNFNETDNYKSTNLNATVDVNWVIFRGFSARIQKDMLEEYEKMSEGNLAITVENTIQNVITAYYGVLLEQENLNISELNMNLSLDRYQREKQKKDMGTSVSYDLLQAKNAYLNDTAAFLMAQTSFKNSVRQFRITSYNVCYTKLLRFKFRCNQNSFVNTILNYITQHAGKFKYTFRSLVRL